ncbi:MAG: hypothetical protein GXP33_07540 [Spirochaetes bacterium]|nr:hypothetical protein [Spirochaetota bacterium]
MIRTAGSKQNAGNNYFFLFILLIVLSSCATRPLVTPAVEMYDRMINDIKLGNGEKALKDFEDLPEGFKKRADNQILHAKILISLKRLKEAENILSAVIKDNSDNTDALYSLSMVYGYQNRIKAQKLILKKIIKIDPRYTAAYSSLGQLYLYGSGPAEDKIKQASVFFNRALDLDSENTQALSGMAFINKKKKKYTESLGFYNRAVKTDVKNPYIYLDRASVKKQLNDTKGALEDLNTAVTLAPGYYWSYIDRGILYLDINRTEPALKDFNSAIKADSSDFVAYAYKAGILYSTTSLLDETIETYRKLISLKPEYYFAYPPLGVLYFIKGKWEESIRFFKKAYTYETEEFAYPLLITLAYRYAGEKDRAEKYLEKEIVNFPRNSWYYQTARFLLNPMRDGFIIQRADKESNRPVRERILFYIASQYRLMKRFSSASTYLLEVADSGLKGKPEFKIAREQIRLRKGGS